MRPTIIPVASGKGGVGKTLLTANLALALAEMGYNTIAVDLDLGGSNLHTYLGLKNNHAGIGDYLQAEVRPLEQFVVRTDFPKLHFLAGDVRSLFMANISFAQKWELIRGLRSLQCDYLLLDLGAGSAFHTLDFFGMSPQGLLVCTTEYAAIMNLLTFLKNFAFRIIQRALPRRRPVLQQALADLLKRTATEPSLTLEIVQHTLSQIDEPAARAAGRVWQRFLPRVVFNMGYHPDELKMLEQLDQTIRNVLSLRIDYIGLVYESSIARRSVRNRIPLLPSAPESFAVQDIKLVAEQIVRLWNQPLRNGSPLLYQNSRAIYNLRQGLE